MPDVVDEATDGRPGCAKKAEFAGMAGVTGAAMLKQAPMGPRRDGRGLRGPARGSEGRKTTMKRKPRVAGEKIKWC